MASAWSQRGYAAYLATALLPILGTQVFITVYIGSNLTRFIQIQRPPPELSFYLFDSIWSMVFFAWFYIHLGWFSEAGVGLAMVLAEATTAALWLVGGALWLKHVGVPVRCDSNVTGFCESIMIVSIFPFLLFGGFLFLTGLDGHRWWRRRAVAKAANKDWDTNPDSFETSSEYAASVVSADAPAQKPVWKTRASTDLPPLTIPEDREKWADSPGLVSSVTARTSPIPNNVGNPLGYNTAKPPMYAAEPPAPAINATENPYLTPTTSSPLVPGGPSPNSVPIPKITESPPSVSSVEANTSPPSYSHSPSPPSSQGTSPPAPPPPITPVAHEPLRATPGHLSSAPHPGAYREMYDRSVSPFTILPEDPYGAGRRIC